MQQTISYNVLAPGPVNIHPKVLQTLSLPSIHHRTPEFDKILARTLTNLKIIFNTHEPVFILTSTGSGGMESLLINTLNPGDKVLGIDSGKFGERWCEMAKVFGANLTTLKVEWGKSVHVGDVAAHLQKNPDTKIVFCQACETSTGAQHPIRELGELIHNYPDCLFLVDGITALGAQPLPMDQWHIDGLVGGSQKAFMLPAGLSFVSFSQKAWKKINSNKQARYYFDIRHELKANQKGETFFSSNVFLIRALDTVLQIILEQGLDNHLLEIEKRALFTRKYAQVLGFSIYPESPSSSITALVTPMNMDSQKIRTILEEKHHITIMGGQDQLKGKINRIGHMGYITWDQQYELIEKLALTLKEINPQWQASMPMEQLRLQMKGYPSHA